MQIHNLFAYIDPATTAIILQVLVGFFVAFGLVFAIWWRKITTWIRSLFVRKGKKDETQAKGHIIVWGDRTEAEVISEIEKLNEEDIYEITVMVKEITPEFERLSFKYGVEFEVEKEETAE